jgi:hypothetical protein
MQYMRLFGGANDHITNCTNNHELKTSGNEWWCVARESRLAKIC